jgi:rubrerythrin
MPKKKPSKRQCTGKQRHTQPQAFAHLANLKKKDGAFRMQAYRCQICGTWHVGHKPRNRGGHR